MAITNNNDLIDYLLDYDNPHLNVQLCLFDSNDGIPYEHYVYARFIGKHYNNLPYELAAKQEFAALIKQANLNDLALVTEDVGYRIEREKFTPQMVTVLWPTEFEEGDETFQGVLIDLTDPTIWLKLTVDRPTFFDPKPRFITKQEQFKMVAHVERHCLYSNQFNEVNQPIPVYSSDYEAEGFADYDPSAAQYFYFLKGVSNKDDCDENLNFTYGFDHKNYF
ncbi:hypothetical protein RMR21_009490 [Agrobacterium sp. rho-8.1]|nr:hypothetical protein [Agrobacterium sp. rho-8.1]